VKNFDSQNLRSESRPSLAELRALGKSLREKCPRSSHAVWKAPDSRPDPLRLLEESNQGRISELIPIRCGRMVRTPFAFYRGAALNMHAFDTAIAAVATAYADQSERDHAILENAVRSGHLEAVME
jgi:hypothetical protein